MTYRQILVHVDDAQPSAERVAAAVRLARQFDAALVGAYLVPTATLTPSVAALLPGDVVKARLAETGGAQHDAEHAFRRAAAGVRAVEWRAPAGPPIDAAIAHARACDLCIVGQPRPGAGEAAFAIDLAAAAILSSGRPVLCVPWIGAPPTLGTDVLVAWDGGREATRAIADALPFLAAAQRVRVVAVNRDEDAELTGKVAAARLGGWLAQHGVAVTGIDHDTTDVDVAAWLLSRAADLESDLVVMGGYAHARMREAVLGGVTRSMLGAMTVPVLMSH
jgi:nucleotide-binding universal stress UspA family protein